MRPIATGARTVDLVAASIIVTKTNSAVRNISINRPCSIEVPPPNLVPTSSGPGNKAETAPAAAIPPSNWLARANRPRQTDSLPTRHFANVT